MATRNVKGKINYTGLQYLENDFEKTSLKIGNKK
jgi:hypothetical protein